MQLPGCTSLSAFDMGMGVSSDLGLGFTFSIVFTRERLPSALRARHKQSRELRTCFKRSVNSTKHTESETKRIIVKHSAQLTNLSH